MDPLIELTPGDTNFIQQRRMMGSLLTFHDARLRPFNTDESKFPGHADAIEFAEPIDGFYCPEFTEVSRERFGEVPGSAGRDRRRK